MPYFHKFNPLRHGAICIAIASIFAIGDSFATDTAEKHAKSQSGSSAQQFEIPVPIGEPVRGIHVPHYTEEGKLAMEFDAEMAQKLDEKHIEMKNLLIKIFEEEKTPMKVKLPDSVFNLETEILTSKNHVIIQRDDFRIEGNSGEFNVRERLGKVAGDVKMTIYSKEEFK